MIVHRLANRAGICCSFIALACCPMLLSAQQTDASDDTSDGLSDVVSEEHELSLSERTRAREISTAQYDELVALARILGLDTTGSRTTLQQRLARYYEIELPEPPEQEVDRRRVTIEDAAELRYVQLVDPEREYIRLSGGVRIEVVDDTDGSRHRIEADSIVINQVESVLTASGNIVYEIDRDGEVERFTGRGLTVELDTWAGAFLYGTSTRPREVEGQDLNFRFSGESISRSADDVIVIEDGIVTSSVSDPPNYRITASRIWVLDPGDWGLQGAVLMVGRVPMFYFPYFFHPGRPMFLHPSFGVRDGDGAYVQTTIYLVGSREDRTQPLSVLRLAEDGTDQERVREGLFMRPARENDVTSESGNTVRLYTDMYSTLGAFLGFDAEVEPAGIWTGLSAFAGVGASRVRYATGDGRYSSYFLDSDGRAVEFWSGSMFPGVPLPVRFGVDVETGVRVGGLTASARLPVYSDSVFERHFLDRSEFIDWGSIIGFSDPSSETRSMRSTLNWRLRTTFSADVGSLNPFVTQARISALNSELVWRRRTIGPNLLPAHIEGAAGPPYDPPDGSFFYPERVIVPDISARIAGTLIDSRRQSAVPDEDGAGALDPRIRVPFNDPEQSLDDVAENGVGIERVGRIPSPRPDLTVQQPRPPWSYRVGYSVAPQYTVTGRYRATDWTAPDDVDFEIDYWEESRRVQSSVQYRSAYVDPLFTVDGTLSVNDRYRDVFGFSEELTPIEQADLRERAFADHSTRVENRLAIQSSPLQGAPLLRGSSLRYNLDVRLIDRSFTTFVGETPIHAVETVQWDRESIRRHSTGATLAVNVWNARQTVGVDFNLPPLQERGSGQIVLRTGPLESRLQAGYRRSDDTGTVEPDPVTLTEVLTITDSTSARHQLQYDIDGAYVTTMRSDLSLGSLTSRLDMRRTESFEFDLEAFQWTGQDNVELRPTNFSVRYNDRLDIEPLWRNRIEIDPSISTALNSDLLRFTNSSITFNLDVQLGIHRFLDLRFRSETRNTQVYRYFPGYTERLGLPRRSFIGDLLRSFNFFDRSDRERSAFNLRALSVDAIHDLGDWDLTVRYVGRPVQREVGDTSRIEWDARVDISLDWRPIPEISQDFNISEGRVDW